MEWMREHLAEQEQMTRELKTLSYFFCILLRSNAAEEFLEQWFNTAQIINVLFLHFVQGNVFYDPEVLPHSPRFTSQ